VTLYCKLKYVHGPDLDEPLAVAKGNSVYYYHADGAGSIVALTNGTEATVEGYTYDTFGKFQRFGNAVMNTYGFTGREYDAETGLYYYRARYYDPETGRFISKDPIGFAGGDANQYNYVLGDPVNWGDPWGLAKWKGFLTVTAGGEVFGGGIIIGAFESDVQDGKKATVVVLGVMGGVTAGLPVSTTTGQITLETPGAPNPKDFAGSILFISANAGLVRTGGASYVKIGSAKSQGLFSFQYGLDASTSGYLGRSFVIGGNITNVSRNQGQSCK